MAVVASRLRIMIKFSSSVISETMRCICRAGLLFAGGGRSGFTHCHNVASANPFRKSAAIAGVFPGCATNDPESKSSVIFNGLNMLAG
jgi:hypothetical protein